MSRLRTLERRLAAVGLAVALTGLVACRSVQDSALAEAGSSSEHLLVYDLIDGTPQNRASLDLLTAAQALDEHCRTEPGSEYRGNRVVHRDPSFGVRDVFPNGLVSENHEREQTELEPADQAGTSAERDCPPEAIPKVAALYAEHVDVWAELPDDLDDQLNSAYMASPELTQLNAEYLACMSDKGFGLESRGQIGDLVIGETEPGATFDLRPGSDEFDRAIWAADFECLSPRQARIIDLMAAADAPILADYEDTFDRLAAQWNKIDEAAAQVRALGIFVEPE